MFKFISILTLLVPVFLFLRTLLRHSTVASKAAADFRRQIDYLVWVILFTVAAATLYSLVNLLYPMWK
jgi:hypothetical protein